MNFRNGPAPTNAANSQPAPAKTSGMAIAALILGILPFTGLLGIIFGIIAMVQINGSRGRLKGSGLAIGGMATGLVFSVAAVVITLLMVNVARKVVTSNEFQQQMAQGDPAVAEQTCTSRQRQLTQAYNMYWQDNGDRLPDPGKFQTSIMPYIRVDTSDIFQCPADISGAQSSYGCNGNLKNLTCLAIKSPATTVVVADCTASANNILSSSADFDLRHNQCAVVGFFDGHAITLATAPDLALK